MGVIGSVAESARDKIGRVLKAALHGSDTGVAGQGRYSPIFEISEAQPGIMRERRSAGHPKQKIICVANQGTAAVSCRQVPGTHRCPLMPLRHTTTTVKAPVMTDLIKSAASLFWHGSPVTAHLRRCPQLVPTCSIISRRDHPAALSAARLSGSFLRDQSEAAAYAVLAACRVRAPHKEK